MALDGPMKIRFAIGEDALNAAADAAIAGVDFGAPTTIGGFPVYEAEVKDGSVRFLVDPGTLCLDYLVRDMTIIPEDYGGIGAFLGRRWGHYTRCD